MWTCRTKNISKNQNLYPQQSQITLFALPWDTLYRVSHSKVSKVILLWWGYRFQFMLIFWILRVHGIGAFMPNSSVFIFLMLYRMICKNPKLFFGKNSLNVTNEKLLSIFFQRFWLFHAFLVRMTACTLHIKWFPWHQEHKWPQWPQQP